MRGDLAMKEQANMYVSMNKEISKDKKNQQFQNRFIILYT